MARTRSLKPSFFTDAELTLFPPLHRLAYEGLWCWADRRGVLEDKPRELKVQILPFDECDFDAVLSDLSRPKPDGSPGFIRRYQINGKRYLHIRKFLAHQKPHPKETEFLMPGPPPEEAAAEPIPSRGKTLADPEQATGQSGGSLVLGFGSLVLGVGSTETHPAADGVRAMSGLSAPVVAQQAKGLVDGGKANFPRAPEKPTKDVDLWDGDDLWAWAQAKRNEAGLAPERGKPRDLGSWFSACLMQGTSVQTLRLAFVAFGNDPYWTDPARKPPLPFAGFISQWERFAPQEVSRVAS